MLVTGGGVVVGGVVVGRVVLGWVEAGCVLGSFLGGVVEGGAVEGVGSAQLGGLAGTVGMLLAGLAVGELVVGNGEDRAAGEVETPGMTAGWAVVFPGCPVRAVTAAYVPPPNARTSRAAAAIRVPWGRLGSRRRLTGPGRGPPWCGPPGSADGGPAGPGEGWTVARPDGGGAALAKMPQNGSRVSAGSFCGSSKYPRLGPVSLAGGAAIPRGGP
jgi:hypothetical protein